MRSVYASASAAGGATARFPKRPPRCSTKPSASCEPDAAQPRTRRRGARSTCWPPSTGRTSSICASARRTASAGNLDAALRHARAAALARPYDVDSRLSLGNVRLARNELLEAAHEFDAVIEEFGAEPDAASGRRATILARGEAPVDELAASDADWRDAARLLVGLWSAAGIVERRLAALGGADALSLALLDTVLDAVRAEAQISAEQET